MAIELTRTSPSEILISGDRTNDDDRVIIDGLFVALRRHLDDPLSERELAIWQEAYRKGRATERAVHEV